MRQESVSYTTNELIYEEGLYDLETGQYKTANLRQAPYVEAAVLIAGWIQNISEEVPAVHGPARPFGRSA